MRVTMRCFKNLIGLMVIVIILRYITNKENHREKPAQKPTQKPMQKPTQKPALDVVYMNLDRNLKRTKHMKKLLKVVGIERYRRFRAVDGKQLYTNDYYLNSFNQSKNIKFDIDSKDDSKRATKATWLSYLFLFKDFAASSSNQSLLILEDDVDIEVDFVRLLNDSMMKAPSDWDILLCGYCCLGEMEDKKVRNNIWIPVLSFATTHCFVVRNSTVARFIATKADVKVIKQPIDLFISEMAPSKELNIYALKNKIAIQEREIFETDNPDSGKITDKQMLENSAIKRFMEKS
jgi:GR25 family glycosyltransferase involved in LPS biosynthesis